MARRQLVAVVVLAVVLATASVAALPFPAQAASGPAGPAGATADTPMADGSSLLVRFAPGLPAESRRQFAAEHGCRLDEAVDGTGFWLLSTPTEAAARILAEVAGDPRLEAAEPNWVRHAATVPSDPHYPGNQPYLDTLHLPAAWELSTGADDLVLAIVDSGVDVDHPELAGRLLPGRDLVNDDSSPDDNFGHGTQVATVAAATGNDGIGMAGVVWRGKILPVKVLDARGAGRDSDIAEGIVWAADQGADVINLSLFGRTSSETVAAAVEYALERDVVVVAAAGNDASSSRRYPAAYDGVIAVSATDPDLRLAPFSNYGPWVDLAAPGVGILAGWSDGTHRAMEGTSFAAPLVSGVAMLARARFPGEDAAAIAAHLAAGARDIGLLGRDDLFGHGLVDALGALDGPRPEHRLAAAAAAGEPDNTPDRAAPVDPAVAATAALAPAGDVDWFSLDVAGPQLLTVSFTPPAGAPAGTANHLVSVFGPDLRPAPVVSTSPEGVTVSASGGRHTIRVTNPSAFTHPGPYQLAVALGPPPLPADPAAGEQLWVRDTTPADGAWLGTPETAPALRFARPIDPQSMADAVVALTDGASGVAVAGHAHYDPATNSVVFGPREPLRRGSAYVLTMTGVRDQTGATIPDGDGVVRFGVPHPPPAPVPPAPPPPAAPDPPVPSGYWMLGADGAVYAFGDARYAGQAAPLPAPAMAVDLEPAPSGQGYWIVTAAGAVYGFDAPYLGGVDAASLQRGETVTSLSATPGGRGYWIFTTAGRVFAFGDAAHLGDMGLVALNGPVLDSIATPSGRGYYLVAADGGIFAFGDARFSGSMGGIPLNAPVQSLVPDPDGTGYWLVASDGGVFSFEAGFRGSMGGKPLNAPVTGMVPNGTGYLMVASDGGIFNFSDRAFHGSLGGRPPASPIVAVAALS